ncbi:hypothetical protein [Dyella sp.]|nr:hypothetical protein [Dyella sp.]HKT29591.1 hypothetical protein [Dyella sp.]
MDVLGFEERGIQRLWVERHWMIRFAHPFGAVHSDVLRASRYVQLSLE